MVPTNNPLGSPSVRLLESRWQSITTTQRYLTEYVATEQQDSGFSGSLLLCFTNSRTALHRLLGPLWLLRRIDAQLDELWNASLDSEDFDPERLNDYRKEIYSKWLDAALAWLTHRIWWRSWRSSYRTRVRAAIEMTRALMADEWRGPPGDATVETELDLSLNGYQWPKTDPDFLRAAQTTLKQNARTLRRLK